MEYALRALGNRELLEIEAEAYRDVGRAKAALVTMIGIEQKFDLLYSNHRDFELELLDLSLTQVLKRGIAWQTFQDDIAAISRRLANLLSAARLYLDQIQHDLSKAFGPDSAILASLRSAARAQYDGRLGYRVMEGLRNEMQHRSMPVHRLAYPHETVDDGLQYRAVPSIEVDRLTGGSIKPVVLAELRGLGPHVPITPLVREYVEGLGVVHELLRSQAVPDVERWDHVLSSMQERGVARWGGNEQSAFLALHLDPEGRTMETIEVFTDLIRYRKRFEQRNGVLTNLARRFVSGQADGDDA